METYLVAPRSNDMVVKPHKEKLKWGIAIAYMLITTAILLVKEITIPRMSDGRTLEQALAIHEIRINRLETITLKLDTIEKGAAERTEAISTLKATVDRIERKLDTHMDKDK